MKTPEEMYYEWRQAFDESLDERMCKREPIELQLLHQELGKETFLAGYKAAKAIVEEELQAVQAQRAEYPGLGAAQYALKNVLAKMGQV